MAIIAVSLLLVPVRCDASPAPHSIFVDPIDDDHAHHHAREELSEHAGESVGEHRHAERSEDVVAGLTEVEMHDHRFSRHHDMVVLLQYEAGGTFAAPSARISDASHQQEKAPDTPADANSLETIGSTIDAPFSVAIPGFAPSAATSLMRVIRADFVANLPTLPLIGPPTPPPRNTF